MILFILCVILECSAFALDGDLDEGLKLVAHSENVKAAEAEKAAAAKSGNNGNKQATSETDKMEASADDAWYFAQKVEKGLVKIISGNNTNAAAQGTSGGSAEEVEKLRRELKKLKKELEEKDRELAAK